MSSILCLALVLLPLSAFASDGISYVVEEVQPFMVSIVDRKVYRCTGAVLNTRRVLTTALCADSSEKIRVLANSVHCNLKDPDNPIAYDVIERFQHPSFNRFTLFADVAVLTVDRQMVSVQPVYVLDRPLWVGQDLVQVWGWNMDFTANFDTEDLFVANTTVLDNLVCVQHYGELFLPDDMSCLDMWHYDNSTGQDLEYVAGCEMSPSALVTLKKDTRTLLAGLGLFAGGCLYRGWPGVFVDTHRYKEWIMGFMGDVVEE